MIKDNPRMYVVVGGKWFDKVNGNTYCNAKIYDPRTSTIFYAGYEYGYGSYYLETAKKEIQRREETLLHNCPTLKAYEGFGDGNFYVVDMGSFYLNKTDVKNGNF